MRVTEFLRRHFLAALGAAVAFGGAVTGAVYWISRPEPVEFVATGEVEPLEPLPDVELPPAPPSDAPLAELAAWIRPHDGEYRWLAIPWQKSILRAQELATKTHRLIFLWGTNQPVGRC